MSSTLDTINVNRLRDNRKHTHIYTHTIYPNIQHQYGKRGRRGRDHMAAAFTTITTDVASLNLDQGKVYNINRLLYSAMYVAFRPIRVSNTIQTCGVSSNTGFQYNTDSYNIIPYCT